MGLLYLLDTDIKVSATISSLLIQPTEWQKYDENCGVMTMF
jgi:hypothetical protein